MTHLFESAEREGVDTSFGEGGVLEDGQAEFFEGNSEACRNLRLSQSVLNWELRGGKHT